MHLHYVSVAIKFHYKFNIRHITRVFQGILISTVEKLKEHKKMAKLWIHECERVLKEN